MSVRFEQDVRRDVIRAAEAAALRRGSAHFEAEHLLLALAGRDDETAALLADHGLDPAGLERALDDEFERSLAAAGVVLAEHRLPDPPAPARRRRGPAASAKRALVRAYEVAKRGHVRRITGPVLLAGILTAELGTVPRALDVAGVDRAALRARAEELLAA